MKVCVAIAVILAALGIWGRHLCRPGGDLRDTTGVTAAVLKMERAERGYLVRCRVENGRARLAEQVVLTLTLVDASGRTVAANPLVGVARLAPAETREIQALIPTPGPATGLSATSEVTLVRWSK